MAHPLQSMQESKQKQKKPPKELEDIRLKEGEDGGHVVEHHFTSYEHKPESFPFSDGDGKALVQHLIDHAHIKGVNLGEEDE